MNIKNEKIDKLASMLLAGGKMLSRHCPECKTPLFKYMDRVICPICKGEVVRREKTDSKEDIKVRKEDNERSDEYDSTLKKIIRNKLTQLEDKLADEDDPKKVDEILKAINSTLDVLERLKKR